ncbi:MAG TPA: polysaccharide deacetylase [Rhodoblastus sp.]|nr:polysaccharide deacetylase [Rhodoblastus sp.]
MFWKSLFAALCLSGAAASMARADEACRAPATIADESGARIADYRAVFQSCRRDGRAARLAIRAFSVDGRKLLLTVDPDRLTTQIDEAGCWTCADTTDEAQKDTRYLRALRAAEARSFTTGTISRNAGLAHGAGAGSFVTADLCPSHKPLDRGFLDMLAKLGPHTPVALSISGSWLAHHGVDFDWLRDKARSGALDITWVDHTYSHPYVPGLADAQNFMLRPGADLTREVFETEKLLLSRGATPSIFFRFPGLVADEKLMDRLRGLHLLALGADAWLVLSPAPRPGSIVLVHANGNEPAGLRLFSRLLDKGAIPTPLRPIDEAP